MIDLLLKLPNKKTADALATAIGCLAEDGSYQTTARYAIAAIGEHHTPTGKMLKGELGKFPEMVGDGNFWVMVRLVDDAVIPDSLDPYIVKRDADDKDQPKQNWA